MDSLDFCLVCLVDEINHADGVVVLDEEDVGGRSWPDLHVEADGIELDPLYNLVQLEVANEQIVALADVTDVTG